MKRLLGLMLLLIFIVSCGVNKDINYYAGMKTPYSYQSVSYTAPPEGYSPFYIDYTGRHGSRYMGDPTEKVISEILQKAKNANLLTEKGLVLLEQVNRFADVNEGSYGLLTAVGETELEGIGERILSQYPEVFKGSYLKVLTTDKERTKQSARAFLKLYGSKYDINQVKQESDTAQVTLRFFDYSPAYNTYRKSDFVKIVVDSIRTSEENELHTQNVLKQIFGKEFIEELNTEIVLANGSTYDSRKFAMSLYDLYTSTLSLPANVVDKYKLSFEQCFNEEEKKWFDKAISSRSYMTLGPAFDADGIQSKVAAPLLISILQTADSVINGKTIDAFLKFAHAETTTPLTTLLEVEGADKHASTIKDFDNYWSTETIAPMAANILLVFYKNQDATSPVLVKVLLNEKEVRIPVQTSTYPYYSWSGVKIFYYSKLSRLGVDTAKPSVELLMELY